jgi:hypothetical protein
MRRKRRQRPGQREELRGFHRGECGQEIREGTAAFSAGIDDQQVPLQQKERPPDESGGLSSKMERAKRLELIRSLLEAFAIQARCLSPEHLCTPLDTLAAMLINLSYPSGSQEGGDEPSCRA